MHTNSTNAYSAADNSIASIPLAWKHYQQPRRRHSAHCCAAQPALAGCWSCAAAAPCPCWCEACLLAP
eukprot:17344-Heterococcus_DN1.PRE.3